MTRKDRMTKRVATQAISCNTTVLNLSNYNSWRLLRPQIAFLSWQNLWHSP